MASAAADTSEQTLGVDRVAVARRWLTEYRAATPATDMLYASGLDDPAWNALLEELADRSGDDLNAVRERVQRDAADIGTGFRIPGEVDERAWPLSPVPLLIEKREWSGIESGVAQRAELLERILVDCYGLQKLVHNGSLPATLLTGSPYFLRPMMGLVPPGGYHLNFVAFDLCRGPAGEWRVLADHLRAPAGAGYALENRLAMARMLGALQSQLNIERHAPFFTALRDGIAARCRRSDPRIGLLTPGRLSPSYAEQAHLARYLGFLLVEGADLSVRDDRVYLRTIGGLKRVDALWRRVDPRLIDPLAFDSTSAIGVPGLIDAMAQGEVVIANSPGSAMLESPAFAAFLPRLCTRLTGDSLRLPNIATWWCGQPRECEEVAADLNNMLIAPAFGVGTNVLPDGAAMLGSAMSPAMQDALRADLLRRPQDYVGQEVVRLSTMPLVSNGKLAARPFTLRVFAARGADGSWHVLPGGFAQIGEKPDARAAVMGAGNWSADVVIHGAEPVPPVTLLTASDATPLRRNPGTLPSRAADNLFWLGRYLERGQARLGVVRALLGHSISADSGAALDSDTVARLVSIVVDASAAPAPETLGRVHLTRFAEAAMDARDGYHGVRAINRQARAIGAISRDRLSADMIRLLDAPFPTRGSALDRAGSLQRRYLALAGLSSEHMGRNDGWRFHDLGRRVERAQALLAAIRVLGSDTATSDDLTALLDLADSQISYRQRYLTGIARAAVIDLVALDPGNPRSIAFQIATINQHLAALPVLSDDGMAEGQQALGRELELMVATARGDALGLDQIYAFGNKLADLSDAVARRYFLQGAEPLRASALVVG